MAAPVPTPKAILRGHKAAVHATEFLWRNERLASGDAEGYIVIWDVSIMRPKAVWRAHESAILGIKAWGPDKIITHGRDHKLIVWKLEAGDEKGLSAALPVEEVAAKRPQPWMTNLLEVNTMNFCAFGVCSRIATDQGIGSASSILVTVPNTLASEAIDIYEVPSQSRIHTVQPGKGNGMAMSLVLFHHQETLTLLAGFENGYASVHRLLENGIWITTYRSQAHSQPILSLDIHPSCESFITSSADSIIAKHPIPTTQQEVPAPFDPSNRIIEEIEASGETSPSLLSAGLKKQPAQNTSSSTSTWKEWEHPLKVVNTKHAGQQGLRLRSDGRIFATAGWDTKIRIYSAKTMKELAVLQWHKVGCYAVAFANVKTADPSSSDSTGDTGSQSQNVDETLTQAMVNTTGNRGQQTSVALRRISQARTTHWVAAGAKDGKISLWDMY
ncbi:hypothetical protein S40293_01526 [Stachybotrys chartarum IBT 40293]|nr:hypothetical protein S40293_01526 [Stachybotrys chartarum IBT 40293]KFA78816.1 hypothetical protein S40288_05493 [Stachybotrys chartarum IBT 40288]